MWNWRAKWIRSNSLNLVYMKAVLSSFFFKGLCVHQLQLLWSLYSSYTSVDAEMWRLMLSWGRISYIQHNVCCVIARAVWVSRLWKCSFLKDSWAFTARSHIWNWWSGTMCSNTSGQKKGSRFSFCVFLCLLVLLLVFMCTAMSWPLHLYTHLAPGAVKWARL